MVSKHDHLRLFALLTCLYVQHQVRLRVLNVKWHLHKQDVVYSRGKNVAITAPLLSVHWPTVFICYYTTSNMHLQSTYNITGRGGFTVKADEV